MLEEGVMEGPILLGLIWVGIAIWLGAVDAAWRRWDSFHERWLESAEESWLETPRTDSPAE
jgi:hypothetical protein